MKEYGMTSVGLSAPLARYIYQNTKKNSNLATKAMVLFQMLQVAPRVSPRTESFKRFDKFKCSYVNKSSEAN